MPVFVSAAVAGVMALTGCSASSATSSDATVADAASPVSSAAAALTVRDPWVKAVDSGMTAAFGTLVNNTGAEVTVVSATSPASPMELHTMVMKDGQMVMQPKEGGFVVPAGGTHELSPGGDHLMLMEPSAAIKPGDELSFTLQLASGDPVTFTAIAKPFAGAGESYDPSMTMPSATASAAS
ncbi:copper chaperone PCu(A)C [Actinoplanes sp. NPDC051851]|uniref:copper chaperone PCu(A)C n=1 Tax=Actinoplanes sp. NPDC051851 TaxID=3154753 RepID=UPI003443B27E